MYTQDAASVTRETKTLAQTQAQSCVLSVQETYVAGDQERSVVVLLLLLLCWCCNAVLLSLSCTCSCVLLRLFLHLVVCWVVLHCVCRKVTQGEFFHLIRRGQFDLLRKKFRTLLAFEQGMCLRVCSVVFMRALCCAFCASCFHSDCCVFCVSSC